MYICMHIRDILAGESLLSLCIFYLCIFSGKMQLTHIPASDDTRDDTEMCVCIYSGDVCGDSCSQKASTTTSLDVRCRRVMGRTYMCAHVVGTARSDLLGSTIYRFIQFNT